MSLPPRQRGSEFDPTADGLTPEPPYVDDKDVDRRFFSSCWVYFVIFLAFILSWPVSIVGESKLGQDRWAIPLVVLWLTAIVIARVLWWRGHRSLGPRSTAQSAGVRAPATVVAAYVMFGALALAVFELLVTASLSAVPTTGPDDPSHAKTAGIPDPVRIAARTGDPSGTNNLSGALKAVEDLGAAGQEPVWIVYLASVSGPPAAFSNFRNEAVAVTANGEQINPDLAAKYAPYSRLGKSGAWLYLGFGLDRATMNAIAAFLALELVAIFVWARSERLRAIQFTQSVRLVPRNLLVLPVVLAQGVAFYVLVRFVMWGDPVATAVLVVWATTLAIAVLIARLLIPDSVEAVAIVLAFGRSRASHAH